LQRLKLRIEPIPVSTWGRSLSNLLPREEWDEIRNQVYREANYKCQICGSTDKEFHAHEQWLFNDTKAIQKLAGIICVCKTCHNCIHMGRSKMVYKASRIEILIRHWCKVNKKRRADFYAYEKEIFEINKKRADKYYIVKVGHKILA